MKYFLRDGLHYEPIKWVMELIAKHLRIEIEQVEHPDIANFTVGNGLGDQVPVSEAFYIKLANLQFSHKHFFDQELLIRTDSGEPDYLSTIFYLVNSIQEYGSDEKDFDHYGRFRYESSVQYTFGIIESNYVAELIHFFTKQIELFNISNNYIPAKSRIFISHDIDFLYSGIKMELLWAVRKGDLLSLWKLIYQYALGNHPYFNIDRIAKLDTEHGFKSCFYWIAKKGKSNEGIKNADYQIQNKKIRGLLDTVENAGSENGLHKSTLSHTMKEEVKAFGRPINTNRFHFLKFKLPDAYSEIESAGINMDSSLGFAEHIGFRNSYGLPFRPFNLKENRKYGFIEQPLHVMDGSFIYYMKEDPKNVSRNVIDFIERNKREAIISLLWHNNEISDYSFKEMANAYLDILIYLKEEQFESVLSKDISNEYFTD